VGTWLNVGITTGREMGTGSVWCRKQGVSRCKPIQRRGEAEVQAGEQGTVPGRQAGVAVVQRDPGVGGVVVSGPPVGRVRAEEVCNVW